MFWITGTTPEQQHDGQKRFGRPQPCSADLVDMALALGVVGVVWRRCGGSGPGCIDPKPSTTHKAGASSGAGCCAGPFASCGSVPWSASPTRIA